MADIQVQGLAELRRALLGFPKKIQKRGLDKAVFAAARVVEAQAERNAPVSTGALRRNIVAKRGQRRYAPGADSYYIVGVRHGKTNTNPVGRSGKKRTVTGYDRRGQDPFYWRFQELGYTAVGSRKSLSGAKKRRGIKASGTWIPPKRFLQRALTAQARVSVERARQVLTQEIAKL